MNIVTNTVRYNYNPINMKGVNQIENTIRAAKDKIVISEAEHHAVWPLNNNSLLNFDPLLKIYNKRFPVDWFPSIKHEIYLGQKNLQEDKLIELRPEANKTTVTCLPGDSISLGRILPDSIWCQPPFIKRSVDVIKPDSYTVKSRTFIRDFINAIRYMQEGYCAINAHNTYDIQNFFILNDFFNPKSEDDFAQYIPMWLKQHQLTGIKVTGIKNLYENLSPEDKQLLSWKSEYEEKFKQKLKDVKVPIY